MIQLKELKDILFLTPVSTFIWLLMIFLSVAIVYYFHLSYLMIPLFAFSFLLLHEILAFCLFRKGLFPSTERIARVYQWWTFFMDGYKEGDFKKIGSLTEGFFNGNYEKTLEQATTDKFDEVIKLMGLKKGDRVLDVGCGLGNFLLYLKKQGIEGLGLTPSPDQQRVCAQKGLDVRIFDFRCELPSEIVGQFDAVTFMGCLEHFPEYYSVSNYSYVMQSYNNAFKSAAAALSPNSSIKKIFSSTLHRKENYNYSVLDYIQTYLLHGHYSGFYPKEGDFVEACQPYFKVFHTYDASIDYQYSSLACPDHFGNFKVNWTVKKVFIAALLFLVNPFAWCSWLYLIFRTWMWQFGGQTIVAETQRPTKTIWYFYEFVS
jgi:cyclopropane fatty-acyl-phospholipid synthase-like methyltransferase